MTGVTALLILDSLFAAAVLATMFRNDRIVLHHVPLFAGGFLYYWVVPVVVGLFVAQEQPDVPQIWTDAFAAVTPHTFTVYLLAGGGFLLVWIAGTAARKMQRRRHPPARIAVRPEVMDPLLIPMTLLGALICWQIRDQFFLDYSLFYEVENAQRGALLALGVLALSLALLRHASSRAVKEPAGRGRLRIALWFLLAAGLISTGLALGGRMYFVTSLITVALYWSNSVNAISRRLVLGVALVAAAGAAVVGTVRTGLETDISAFAVLRNLALEPVLTGFSLLTYLGRNAPELFNIPVELTSSLLNLVPTALFPLKLDYIVSPEQLGYGPPSPFGAFHNYVSLSINFGIVGSAVVLFFASYALEALRERRQPLTLVMYAMLAGIIPFSFFRDPFYTSIVKSMLQLAILMPIVTWVHMGVVTMAARSGAPPDREVIR